jgi:acetyltransferase-like isoleucine patch superfamily enzyme
VSVYIHPNGLCESTTVGSGSRVWAFAHVLHGAVVGANCNICDGAFVESGARLGDGVTVKNNVLVWDGVTVEDHAFLGPAMVFTNDLTPRAYLRKDRDEFLPTVVRRGASIGAQAVVVCGVEIGAYAMVAAGAVVTRDVPAHGLVAGNPSRLIGWVCWCGRRLDPALGCACGRRYERGTAGGLVEVSGG